MSYHAQPITVSGDYIVHVVFGSLKHNCEVHDLVETVNMTPF